MAPPGASVVGDHRACIPEDALRLHLLIARDELDRHPHVGPRVQRQLHEPVCSPALHQRALLCPSESQHISPSTSVKLAMPEPIQSGTDRGVEHYRQKRAWRSARPSPVELFEHPIVRMVCKRLVWSAGLHRRWLLLLLRRPSILSLGLGMLLRLPRRPAAVWAARGGLHAPRVGCDGGGGTRGDAPGRRLVAAAAHELPEPLVLSQQLLLFLLVLLHGDRGRRRRRGDRSLAVVLVVPGVVAPRAARAVLHGERRVVAAR